MSAFSKCLSLVITIIGGICLSVDHVKAQTTPFSVAAEGLTLSPPSFEMTLKPGEETAHTILITNPTKNLIELYPSAGNFSSSGDGGQPKYAIGAEAIEDDSRYSIASWVSFFTPKIALLPEQVVEFRFRIKVPENAEPGGHYGVVFLGTKPPEERDPNSQVALSTMVGSLLLVRIPGEIRESTIIEEFSAPWFFFTPPVSMNTYLRNTGNVHVRPQGEVVISNWRGQTIQRIDINPVKGNILPESRRKFDVVWNPDTSPFWRTPLGKFDATLKAIYGQNGLQLSQTISFWILPKWFIAFSVFLVISSFLFIIFIIRKRRNTRRPSSNLSSLQNPSFAPTSATLQDDALQKAVRNTGDLGNVRNDFPPHSKFDPNTGTNPDSVKQRKTLRF